MSESVVYGIKPLLRELEALEPGMKKQLVREAKDVVKPIADNIKSHIPRIAPLSGMSKNNNPHGRLAWGAGKPANQVSIRFRSGYSRKSAVTSLVSIWVTSAATAMADVAGKGSMRKSKNLTRSYAYKGGVRKHRVNGGNGGRDFVRNLKARGANDFVYPAVGDSIDDAQQRVKLVLEKYARKVNRRLD
jgi:hypothetical protein